MADAQDQANEASIRAAQAQAERAAAEHRALYGQHPGEGHTAPDGDPEYRRTARDA